MSSSDTIVTYSRVSGDAQEKAGTIGTQHAAHDEYAAANGLTIIKRYNDEAVTGALPFAERPGGAALLRDARAGHFTRLLVYDVSRLGRDTLDIFTTAVALEQAGVAVLYVTQSFEDSPTGRLHFTLEAGLAELGRARIREVTTRGRRRVAAQPNAYTGAILPFGYQAIPGPNGKQQVAIEPGEASIVRRIFRLYLSGHATGTVANMLEREGVPSPRARRTGQAAKWSTNTVARILHNPTYYGERPYADIITPYPPIIERATFDKAQKELSTRRRHRKPDARYYPLRGLLVCGHCGQSYYGNTIRKATAPDGRYYYTHRRASPYAHDPPERCPYTRHTKALPLEEHVWQYVTEMIEGRDATLQRLQQSLESRDTGEDLRAVEQAIQRAKRGQRELIRLLATNPDLAAAIDEQLAENKQELAALEREHARTQDETAQAQERIIRLERAAELLAYHADSGGVVDDEKRAAAFVDLLERVEIIVETGHVDITIKTVLDV